MAWFRMALSVEPLASALPPPVGTAATASATTTATRAPRIPRFLKFMMMGSLPSSPGPDGPTCETAYVHIGPLYIIRTIGKYVCCRGPTGSVGAEGSGPARLAVRATDVLHPRGRGPVSAPGDQLVDTLHGPFEVRLDRTIGLVAHPAGHPEPLGLLAHRGAEEDALDVSGDDDVNRGGGHGSMMQGPGWRRPSGATPIRAGDPDLAHWGRIRRIHDGSFAVRT